MVMGKMAVREKMERGTERERERERAREGDMISDRRFKTEWRKIPIR